MTDQNCWSVGFIQGTSPWLLYRKVVVTWEVFLLQSQTLVLVVSRSGGGTKITNQNAMQWSWRLLECEVACI